MALTRESLLEFLKKKTRAKLDKVGDDDALFSSGVIDSFVMMDLLTHIQKLTGARLGPEDFEKMDSLRGILDLAASKQR